jgi:protein phosphatase
MGTTLVALALSAEAGLACWAHVGDSRLYRMRDGQLALLTADHTRFGGPYAPGSVVPLDLPHTNELLAALGVEASVHADQGSAPEEIERLLLDDRPLAETGKRLFERALDAGGSDNLSLVLVRALPDGARSD